MTWIEETTVLQPRDCTGCSPGLEELLPSAGRSRRSLCLEVVPKLSPLFFSHGQVRGPHGGGVLRGKDKQAYERVRVMFHRNGFSQIVK